MPEAAPQTGARIGFQILSTGPRPGASCTTLHYPLPHPSLSPRMRAETRRQSVAHLTSAGSMSIRQIFCFPARVSESAVSMDLGVTNKMQQQGEIPNIES